MQLFISYFTKNPTVWKFLGRKNGPSKRESPETLASLPRSSLIHAQI